MSLIRIALRHMAVMALKGRTLAGDNVLDSEIGALSEDGGMLQLGQKQHFIAVYTEDSTVKPDFQRGLFENGEVVLGIEFGISEGMTAFVPDPDNPGQEMQIVVPGIAYTNGAFELYLDVLSGQIRYALSSKSKEAGIFRRLFTSISKFDCKRAGSSRHGEQVAAMRLEMHLKVLNEPVFAEDVPSVGPVNEFLECLANGDQDNQARAALLRDLLPEDDTDDEVLRRRVSATYQEMKALGLAI